MSKGDVLYTRGMRTSESDSSGTDFWDDTKLNEAYDKALNIAKAQVAKRIAMSTNNLDMKKSTATKKTPGESLNKNVLWKAGMHCRAIYKEDGLEYEGLLIKIIDKNDCVIKFLGYENSEIVPISSLKPTYGKKEQILQMKSACDDNGQRNSSTAVSPDLMDYDSDEASCLGDIERVQEELKMKMPTKKKGSRPRPKGLQLPDFPFQMPNLNAMEHAGSMDLLLPPPPLIGFSKMERLHSEDDALSSMLISWYMSGYYAGLYQGLKKRAKRNPRNE